jgi:DNA-binding transcriptional LysR family regulator
MDVELRHLRVLAALADEGTFTDAAIAIGVSQAAVSRGLASLEAVVGERLVTRTTRSLAFTDAGLALLAHARAALREVEAGVLAAQGGPRPLLLGYSWSALGARSTAVVRSWNARHPESPLELRRHHVRGGGLIEGLVDVAVVRSPLDGAHLDSVVVGLEPRVVALPVDHPLAAARSAGLGDLLGERVAIDRQLGTTSTSLWTDAGFAQAPATVPTSDVDDWVDLIAAGDAIGVSARSTADRYPHPGIAWIPLDRVPPIEVRLAWRTDRRHPVTDALVLHVRAALDEVPPSPNATADVGGAH